MEDVSIGNIKIRGKRLIMVKYKLILIIIFRIIFIRINFLMLRINFLFIECLIICILVEKCVNRFFNLVFL